MPLQQRLRWEQTGLGHKPSRRSISVSRCLQQSHEDDAEAFAKGRPDIKIAFRAPYKDYEDGTQRVLREAVTGDVPDITFQGLNRVRTFADKGIALALDDSSTPRPIDAAGSNQAMRAAGTVGGKIYGLPFAISLPIAYYNLDLVRKAGGNSETLPTTWDEVIALGRRSTRSATACTGSSFEWSITGNWLWQAEVFRNGGTMLNADESKVAFDGEAGKAAIKTIARLVTEAKSPNFSGGDMRTAFAAGKTGILITSTALLSNLTRQVGDKFEDQDACLPEPDVGHFAAPAGRQCCDHHREDAGQTKGGLGSLEILHRCQRRRGHGRDDRLHGAECQGRGPAEGLLHAQPEPVHRGCAAPYMGSWYAFPARTARRSPT